MAQDGGTNGGAIDEAVLDSEVARAEIDISAPPFQSVKEAAASRFGGIGFGKPNPLKHSSASSGGDAYLPLVEVFRPFIIHVRSLIPLNRSISKIIVHKLRHYMIEDYGDDHGGGVCSKNEKQTLMYSEYKMSTSIIGFLHKNKKFVLFWADSRSIEPECGEVVDDDRIKIYNLCHDFLATGAGYRDIIESVYISVDKENLHKPPPTVNEVAQLIASCGTELIKLSNMFTVLYELESTTDRQ